MASLRENYQVRQSISFTFSLTQYYRDELVFIDKLNLMIINQKKEERDRSMTDITITPKVVTNVAQYKGM